MLMLLQTLSSSIFSSSIFALLICASVKIPVILIHDLIQNMIE